MLKAGSWMAAHWRSVLLGMYGAVLGLFGLLAWVGFRHRDSAGGEILMVLFGFLAMWMLLRFPKRLLRGMRADQVRRRTAIRPISSTPVRRPVHIDGQVIDVESPAPTGPESARGKTGRL